MRKFPIDDARLITFAGIAYGAVGKIPRYLAEAQLLAGEWSIIWIPAAGQNPDNLAYIALNEQAGSAVLAIRGTYPDPLSPIYWNNGQQDSPFGPMVAWKDSASAKISGGTNTGYMNLSGLLDADGRTIAEAVAALDPGISLCVTGHSLGGTLAPVLALDLADREPDRAIYSVSFAGMTPGNAAFAALFDRDGGLSGRTRRVFNTIDSVSYGWNAVLATRNFFTPSPRGGPLVTLFLFIAWLRLTIGGYGFTPIGESVALPGTVQNASSKQGLVSFVIETLHQHMPDTYLALLGAPPLPFSILFGAVTSDGPAPPEVHPQDRAMPVFHI